MDEEVGGLAIPIKATFTGLESDFQAAIQLAVTQGSTLREAINSALKLPDTTPIQDALVALDNATKEAAGGFDKVAVAAKEFGAASENAAVQVRQYSDAAQSVITKQQDLNAAVEQSQRAVIELKAAYDQGAVSAETVARAEKELESATKAAATSQDEATGALKRFTDASGSLMQAGASITAAITVPIVGIGAAAFKAANDLDESYDHIRAATGATGEKLEGLKESFRTVFANVPETAKNVSDAMALIEQRTGLVGAPLEALTTQMVNLAHITGEQVTPMVGAVTRAFKDAGVPVGEYNAKLDEMFRASQATGVGLTQLTDLTVQFGAPMRALGFSFEQSLAVMGSFTKEGVNLQTVLAGMRFALGDMVKAGQDPIVTFQAIVDKIKNTSDATEGLALSFQAFGKRAATDMFDVIKGGHLDIQTLWKTITEGHDTVAKASEDVKSFGEKWQIFENQLKLALEPLGVTLTQALQSVLTNMTPVLEAVKSAAQWFGELPGPVQGTAIALAAAAAAVGPLTVALGGVGFALQGLQGALPAVTAMMDAFGLSAGAANVAASGLAGVLAVGLLAAITGAVLAFHDLHAAMADTEAAASKTDAQFQKFIDNLVSGAKTLDSVRDAQDKLKASLEAGAISQDTYNKKLELLKAAQDDLSKSDFKSSVADLGLVIDDTAMKVVKLAAAHTLSKEEIKAAAAEMKKEATEAENFGKAAELAINKAGDSYADYTGKLEDGGVKAEASLKSIQGLIEKAGVQMESMKGAPLAAMKEWVEALNEAKDKVREFADADAFNKIKDQVGQLDAKVGGIKQPILDVFNSILTGLDGIPGAVSRSGGELIKWLQQVVAEDEKVQKAGQKIVDHMQKISDAAQQKLAGQTIPIIQNLGKELENIGAPEQIVKVVQAFETIRNAAKVHSDEATKAMVDAFDTIVHSANVKLPAVEEQWRLVSKAVDNVATSSIPLVIKAYDDYIARQKDAGASQQELMKLEQTELETVIKVGKAKGEAVGQYVLALEQLKEKEKALNELQELGGKIAVDVSKDINAAFDSIGKTLVDSLTSGKNALDALGKVFEDLGKKILNEFVGGALKAMKDELVLHTSLLDDFEKGIAKVVGSLTGALSGGLKAAGGAVGGLSDAALGTTSQLANLQGALNPLSGIVGSTGTAVEGMGSAASSASSTVASSASSFMGTFSAISAGVSAVTGVIGLFQNAAMHATEKLVEFNTRVSAIVQSKELPLANQIAVEQEGTLHDISSHTAPLSDQLGQIISLLSILGKEITGVSINVSNSGGPVSLGGSISLGGDALGQLKYMVADLDTLKVTTSQIASLIDLSNQGLRNINQSIQNLGALGGKSDAQGTADFYALFGHPEKAAELAAATAAHTATTATNTGATAEATRGVRDATEHTREATERGTQATQGTRDEARGTREAVDRTTGAVQESGRGVAEKIAALQAQELANTVAAAQAMADGNLTLAASYLAANAGIEQQIKTLQGINEGIKSEAGKTKDAAEGTRAAVEGQRGTLQSISDSAKDTANSTKDLKEGSRQSAADLTALRESSGRAANASESTRDNTKQAADHTASIKDASDRISSAAAATQTSSSATATNTAATVTALSGMLTEQQSNDLDRIYEATNHGRVDLDAIFQYLQDQTPNSALLVQLQGILAGTGLLVANSWQLVRDADAALNFASTANASLLSILEDENHIRVDADALVDLIRLQAGPINKMVVDLEGILLGSSLTTAALQSMVSPINGILKAVQSIDSGITGLRADVGLVKSSVDVVGGDVLRVEAGTGHIVTAIGQAAISIAQTVIQAIMAMQQAVSDAVAKAAKETADATKQTAKDVTKAVDDFAASVTAAVAQVAQTVAATTRGGNATNLPGSGTTTTGPTSSGGGGSASGGGGGGSSSGSSGGGVNYTPPGSGSAAGQPGYKSPYQQTGTARPENFIENETQGSRVQIAHDNAEALAGYLAAYRDYVTNMGSHQYIPPDRRNPPTPPNAEVLGPPDIYGVQWPVPGSEPVSPQLPAVPYTGPDQPYGPDKPNSYDTGGWVPYDMKAMVHAGELILTAAQAAGRESLPVIPALAGVPNMATGGFTGTGSVSNYGGGNTSNVYNIYESRNPRETARQIAEIMRTESSKFRTGR